ncbi:hypothetical protein SAMN04515665_1472, partial [Blastococcus sp. DSM 46786]
MEAWIREPLDVSGLSQGYDDRQLPRLVSATLDEGPDGLASQRTSVRYGL